VEWIDLDQERVQVMGSCNLELYCSSNSVDQIKKNEMSGACGKYEGQERCIQGFGRET